MSESRVKRNSPIAGTHLSENDLREYWLADLSLIDEVLAARYRQNDVLFPRSRKDLIERYTKIDLMNFKLTQETDDEGDNADRGTGSR